MTRLTSEFLNPFSSFVDFRGALSALALLSVVWIGALVRRLDPHENLWA